MSEALRLDYGRIGSTYRVLDCAADVRTRSKLEVLGLVPSSELTIISSTKAGLILKVKESRLAIGFDLAKQLTVSPMPTRDEQ